MRCGFLGSGIGYDKIIFIIPLYLRHRNERGREMFYLSL